MDRYFWKRGATRVLCCILVVVLMFGQAAFAASDEDNINLLYLENILQMLRDQYRGELSDDKLVDGAVKGILDSLDDYTTYYTNDEKNNFIDSVTGVFGGIGVSIEAIGDYIVVSGVIRDSPAEKAGILQGDRIIEANGVNLVGATVDRAVSVIKGEAGTMVRIGLLRDGRNTPVYLDIKREVIKVNPVIYEIRSGIGYIKLESFNENADEYLTKALQYMDKNGIFKIALDLRDNPGGEVTQAISVARKFVPRGVITKLDYKSPKYSDITYYSYLEKPKYKLAVLVNGKTASASEIVAGAVQDTGAGRLVGTKTFGKAKFQSIIPILTREAFIKYIDQGIIAVTGYDLQYGGIMPEIGDIAGYAKMTLGVYFTPGGKMIDGKGLVPDIEAKDPEPVSGINVGGIRRLSGTVEPGLNGVGADVCNAEMLLKVLGYKINTVDNVLDSGTAEELKWYQRNAGLEVSGILDRSTQEALNADLEKLIEKHDLQYAAAAKLLNGQD